ncbi:YhcN/YlaJ family sporulation lipoprotein [Tumebacillus lipolyticus]|uniref:YhcN/YlaJ family sporulation lipoprotein n=1 Tax=Tumebacillus lipolyticus TaxID=1280370 RepID=A0ABW4ZYG0_9BACL
MQMQRKWIIGLTAALIAVTIPGCSANNDLAQNQQRYGTNTLQIGPKSAKQEMPRFDNKNIDVDGDGDKEHLSGRNDVSNPSVDLRSFTYPGSTDMSQGIYPTSTADRIQDLASSVDGVANSRAIVVGRTVVLGMNLERTVRPAQKADLVDTVRQRILVQAPVFERVHITTDRALTRRVQRIADELRAGHSLSMYNEEFMDLAKQIPPVGPSTMPAIPRR